MAKTAYGGAGTPTRTARGAEYEIVARVTHALKAALLPGTGGFAALAAALHDNQRLWSVLASDVAEPSNSLPAPLRARIFYLAEFTRMQTRKILSGDATADVLVDINTAVMRGLRGEGSRP